MKRFTFLAALFLFLAVMLAGQDAFAAVQEIKLPEDPTKAYITLGILVVAAIMFFTEVVPLPVTAMLVPVALSLTHVITGKVAFSFFGNDSVVLFMFMFIIGGATFITGFADKVGAMAVKLSKGDPKKLLIYTMLAIGLLSSSLSNTGTIAVAVPMVIGMCRNAKIAPGRILMPIAFASSLGGTLTLVGTPPNGIINSMLAQTGQTPFGYFEFAKIGIPLFVAGILYYTLIGYRFLPKGGVGDEDLSEGGKELRRENKMWYSVAVFAFVVFMMATELVDLTVASGLGVCLMVITGCITMREAYRSVDWTTIFLFAGMLSMSSAMDKSGAAAIVANAVVNLVHDPYMLMAACCGLTAIITNFMSNTATAALMAPLALPIAVASGISPLPITMGIAMSASACFLTPVATPPNTLVLGPGRYNFTDYVKAGWPLQVMTFVICVFLIPQIWPFYL